MPCLINGSRKIPDNHSILSVRVLLSFGWFFMLFFYVLFYCFFMYLLSERYHSPQDPTTNPLESLLFGEGRFSAFHHEMRGGSALSQSESSPPILLFYFRVLLVFFSFWRKNHGNSLKSLKIPSSNQCQSKVQFSERKNP